MKAINVVGFAQLVTDIGSIDSVTRDKIRAEAQQILSGVRHA